MAEEPHDKRIERLLDQLEAPGLSAVDIEKIKKKIEIISALKE